MTCSRSNVEHQVFSYIDPYTGKIEDLEHCPLSIPDAWTWALLETVQRWESGQIVIHYERLCEMPSLLLEAADFVKAVQAQE